MRVLASLGRSRDASWYVEDGAFRDLLVRCGVHEEVRVLLEHLADALEVERLVFVLAALAERRLDVRQRARTGLGQRGGDAIPHRRRSVRQSEREVHLALLESVARRLLELGVSENQQGIHRERQHERGEHRAPVAQQPEDLVPEDELGRAEGAHAEAASLSARFT